MVTLHHVALRVSDLERAKVLYQDAFEAIVLVDHFMVDGPFAEQVSGEAPGVRWHCALMGLGDASIELFAFDVPRHPIDPVPMVRGNQLHFCLEVEDVARALSQAEGAGGRRLWPEVVEMEPGADVIYVADPDQNIIELLSLGRLKLVQVINRAFSAP